jgi:transposase
MILEKRLKELERKLKAYENAHTPPSRSFKRRPLKSSEEKGTPGQKPGHEGTTRSFPSPDRQVKTCAKNCIHCGARLRRASRYESRIIEDVPPPRQAIVTEYLLAHYTCTRCGKETVATHPDLPQEGRFGKSLLTTTAVMKFKNRLPYRKIAQALRDQHGIDITPAAVVGVVGRVAVSLRDEYVEIERRIMKAKVVYADETSIKVNGRKWWIWVFVAGKDTLIAVANSRGQEVVESVLGEGFKGIIVCDGWKPYRTFTQNIQRCWAHLLREADELAEHESGAERLADSLHAMFDTAKELLDSEPPPQKRRWMWRRLRRWLGIWLNKPYHSEREKKFVRKVRNGFDHWFTFILHEGVEPTNNIAERALRESVIQRKIMGCLRNINGTFAHETMMSVFATWENQGLNPYEEMSKFL